MRRIALTLLALVVIPLAAQRVAACDCSHFSVEGASKTSASIFIGQVIDVGEPREIITALQTQKLQVVRFLVWERWKGPKSIEASVLTQLDGAFTGYRINVGDIHLVYADPITVQFGADNVEGIVTGCTRSALLQQSDPQRVIIRPLEDVFKLDKLFKSPAAEQKFSFSPEQKPKHFCMVCCF